jgi:hypothetical protein
LRTRIADADVAQYLASHLQAFVEVSRLEEMSCGTFAQSKHFAPAIVVDGGELVARVPVGLRRLQRAPAIAERFGALLEQRPRRFGGRPERQRLALESDRPLESE